jgi:hypothetical protein
MTCKKINNAIDLTCLLAAVVEITKLDKNIGTVLLSFQNAYFIHRGCSICFKIPRYQQKKIRVGCDQKFQLAIVKINYQMSVLKVMLVILRTLKS